MSLRGVIAMTCTVILSGCAVIPLENQGVGLGVDVGAGATAMQRYTAAWVKEPGKMSINHLLTAAAAYGAQRFFKEYDVSIRRRSEDKPKAEEAVLSDIRITLPDGTVLEIPR